jgi:hypothetical protein
VDLYKFDPNLSPEDFQRYLEVLYTNQVVTPAEYDDAHHSKLCRSYVIAEAMLDRQTRNVIVRALYDYSTVP